MWEKARRLGGGSKKNEERNSNRDRSGRIE
jgi:hypothetical protein